jgi:hypothetical protein
VSWVKIGCRDINPLRRGMVFLEVCGWFYIKVEMRVFPDEHLFTPARVVRKISRGSSCISLLNRSYAMYLTRIMRIFIGFGEISPMDYSPSLI